MLDSTGGKMDSCSENTVDGPIRSRFRGLSWDKKHQGWRVRIYWAGKQRHVGRYEDDVAAAKAYDKSAFYLYGANAITNFCLEACMSDPTEVSPFIVLAKEQAELEQQSKVCSMRVNTSLITNEMLQLKGQQLAQEPFMQPQISLQQQQQQQQQQQYQLHQQQQAYARQHQPPASPLAYAANHAALQAHRMQLQQQQLMGSAVQLQQQMVMLPSPAASTDNTSSMSCITCAVASPSVAVAATAIRDPPPHPPGGYVLCTTPAGQQVLLQLPQNSGAVQQQLQLQQQQQAQQQQAMLFGNSHNCQPLQLSVPPQLTTIAGHVSAAAPAAQNTTPQQAQQQWQLPLQDLVMSLPMAFAASGAECSLPVAPIAAQTAAAAAALATATSMSLSLQSHSGTGCAPEPSGLLDSCHGYSSITASPVAICPVGNFVQQQQVLSHCAATGNVYASEAGSSSRSPMTAVLEPASFQGITAALSNQQQSAGSHYNMSVIQSMGMNGTAHHLAASPMYSCSSSGSSNSRKLAGTIQLLH